MGCPSGPTLAGFVAFIQDNMQISTNDLPTTSPVIGMALAVALGLVNRQLGVAWVPQTDSAGVQLLPNPTSIYTLAVYNLAADNLINYAQDQPGRTLFKRLRKKFNTLGFVSGIIQSATDEGTSESMVVMEAAKNFTLSNLQNLKTPWGRQYLAFAQDYGPSTWGIS
jgi:hypothetical protein